MFDSAQRAPSRETRSTRRWLIVAIATVGSLIAGLAILSSMSDELIEGRLRRATVELLRERLESEVELGTVDVTFTPRMRVRFERLTVRHQGRRDIPPLIALRSFTLETSVLELWNRQVDRLHIEGLDIVIPPGRGHDMPDVSPAGGNPPAAQGQTGEPKKGLRDIQIREIVSEEARLAIMPKRAGKRTREFLLHRIRLEDFQFSRATPFEAALSNPVPAGEIRTVGTFGPWERVEPSITPVGGTFTFDADLGTIKGIAGALSSEGTFSGSLERIETSGRTRTPDFRVSALKGQPLPLVTAYSALVDGTNGDVVLSRVEARLGESLFITTGAVLGIPGVKGRDITLDVTSSGAALEDIFRLAMGGPRPAMTGRLRLTAKLALPPRDVDVLDRMVLDGTFAIDDARFTSDEVQEKIDELSRRGQGRPKDRRVQQVMSDLKGRFHLERGVIRLNDLTFGVQGANIALGGHYNLKSEALDFRGVVSLRARASQTMTGFRSLLLKPFDPLLRKRGAGTRLAIKVTGTRDKPAFGVELGRTLKGK